MSECPDCAIYQEGCENAVEELRNLQYEIRNLRAETEKLRAQLAAAQKWLEADNDIAASANVNWDRKVCFNFREAFRKLIEEGT